MNETKTQPKPDEKHQTHKEHGDHRKGQTGHNPNDPKNRTDDQRLEKGQHNRVPEKAYEKTAL